jgi:ubiquitin thioesterase protein OTUB1
MIMDKNVLFQENEKLKNEIEIFNQIISDIINKLNKVKENLEIYYEIHKSIISNINNKFRNFSILYNINEFVNNTIKRDLENIIKDNNTNNQINNIMKMYNKMEAEKIDSQINNNDDKIFLYEPESESDFNLLNNESENLNKNQNYQQPSQQINNINISKSVNIINKNPQNEKQNEESKKRSTVIGVVNELKNILLEEVINKIPLISELKDINGLLNDCKGDSSQINIVKVITSKYKQYRSIRENGNSFYTCFIYRLFEYISLSRNQSLFDKICQKILNTKNLILQNGYDWDFIKDSFGLFHKEFITCFEQSNISMKTCQLYLDTLFKSEESFNYFNHFIHYCIAAYIKENRILYENYISEKFETWISKVEEIGLEVGQIEILACANYFDIGIKIEYLYPSKVDVVKYPEDKKGEDIFINLLFRPDHYDLLYK